MYHNVISDNIITIIDAVYELNFQLNKTAMRDSSSKTKLKRSTKEIILFRSYSRDSILGSFLVQFPNSIQS